MKYFKILAIALIILGIAYIPAFAAADTVAYGGGTGLGTVKTVTTISGIGPGTDETNVSATAYFIPTKCLLLGYSVQVGNSTTGYDGRIAIIDAASTTTGDKDTKIIAESEALTSYPIERMFPQGIRLTRGLTIKQEPYTIVTVYYIQDRP